MNTIKNLLEIVIVNEVENLLESFRGFNLEQFKQLDSTEAMNEYASKYLPKLGSGSSRRVYGWKAGKVIKIAISDVRNYQNKREIETYINKKEMRPYLATIYDHDDSAYLWIISEGVQVIADNSHLRKKFFLSERILRSLTFSASKGLGFDESLKNAIESHNQEYKETFPIFTEQKPVTLEQLSPFDLELFEKVFTLTKLGIDDVDRYDHWGVTTSGRIVLVDYGL